MEEKVGDCAGALLFGGMGRLEDKGGLNSEKEASRVKKLENGVSL